MELMDTQQAAEFLHLKKSYLYKLVYEKKIPHYKPGHHLLFAREDLELYVSRNRVSADYELDRVATMILNNMQTKPTYRPRKR
jgi:excisionase family DNA binding protein